ncbi:hypothetical protein ACIPPJ_19030 [Streptomyces sp. NPDC086091]|uniref:hypothetical protein n=1 Tax=Streptomyces sp. NPDC086091 TaxID=3365751 RepID=UPI00381A9B67
MTPDRGPARAAHARGTAVRRLLALGALPVLAGLLGGCGIRATEVPTDFGPAPSRVRCSLADQDTTARAARGAPVRVFLLCGSSLVAVDRTVPVPEGTAGGTRRVLVAQNLLDGLAESPTPAEKEAGYTTDVHRMRVSGPAPGDPDDALRLSASPEDLTSYALAQLVCTFSDSAAAEGDGSVVLGGPAPSEEARRYACTDEVRSRPGSKEPPSSEVTKD